MSKHVNYASRIHPTEQSDISEQHWVSLGVKCYRMVNSVARWQLFLSWSKTLRPSVGHRLDDTAFGAGTFSWLDPVHSLKASPGEAMTVVMTTVEEF